MRILLIILLLGVVYTQVNYLNRPGNASINVNQYMLSPSGNARMSLKQNCSIVVEVFDRNKSNYQYYQQYQPNFGNSEKCQHLSIGQKYNVVNNQNGQYSDQFKQLESVTNSYLYLEDRFNGAVLTLTRNLDNATINTQTIQYFSVRAMNAATQNSPPQYFNNLPQTVINDGGWNFTFNNNEVTISKDGINKTLDNRGLSNSWNGVIDRQGQNRYSLLPGMTLHPRAGDTQTCPNNIFQRYYFDIDSFYPYVRIKDQTGYQIGQYGLQPPITEPSKICPPFTFKFYAKCLSKCPSNYYSQIRREYGECLLNCEQGFQIKDKICRSKHYPQVQNAKISNQNVKPYQFGTYCTKKGFYFYSVSQQCVEKCPATFVQLDIGNGVYQGICAHCPENCVTCQIDGQQKNYLECIQCQQGYIKINGKCTLNCDVQFCELCGSSPKTCNKCSSMYRLQNNICTANCSANRLPVLDNNGNLYCSEIPENQSSKYIAGVYQGVPYSVIKQCPLDMIIHNDKCIKQCPPGFIQFNDTDYKVRICVCTNTQEKLYNLGGSCKIVNTQPEGMYYHPIYHTYFNCKPGCLNCQIDRCLQCSSESILIIPESGQTFCQKNSPYFSCNSKYYTFDQNQRICYYKNMVKDCQANKLLNCNICVSNKQFNDSVCLKCSSGFSRMGKCAIQCQEDQQEIDGKCVQIQANCKKMGRRTVTKRFKYNQDFIKSDVFRAMSNDGTIISKDSIQQIMYIRDQFGIQNPNSTAYQQYQFIDQYCLECQRGSLVNGKCIVSPADEKYCQNSTKRFQFNNTCFESCPEKTIPKLVKKQKFEVIVCIPQDQEEAKNLTQLKIDSSVYQLKDGSYLYYFVIDNVLKNDNVQAKIIQKQKLEQATGLITAEDNQPTVTKFLNKTYIAVRSRSDQIALDFRDSLNKLQDVNGQMLGSGVYGVKAQKNHLNYQTSWLAIVAYTLSLMTILLHTVYIGNYLLYKVDNLLIFVQACWYFLFVNLFVGKPLAQYYYGYSWSHFQFFPNYFNGTIPVGYYEGFNPESEYNDKYIPNSYRLGSGDVNFIRNAGFSFSLLITFIIAFFLVLLFIFLLKKICRKYQLWYYKIAKQAFFAAIQFVSFNIMYWAIAHLRYNEHNFSPLSDNQSPESVAFRTGCSIAAIVFIALIVLYMFIRGFFNKYGGLYMLKRIAYAAILVGSAHQFFIQDQLRVTSKQAFVILIVGFQIIFVILRFLLQRPKFKRHRFFIIAEGILMIASFLIMYLWNDTGVVSVFVSLFIFVFILFLIEDLIDVYNDAQDAFYDDDVGVVKGAMQKNLDHPDSERQMFR